MDENEITQRLRDAGDQPVPAEVRASHLHQMHAAAPTVERPKRFGRLAVAAAAFVGFAVGSTGFAMAGALPDPAQNVAHDVLAIVNVNVEKPANRGQCVSEAARLGDHEAKQRCKDEIAPGRSDQAGEGKGRPDHAGTPGGPNPIPHADDPCKGPPPWAGRNGATFAPEEKAAYRQGCPDDDLDDDDAAEAEAEALEDEQERQAELDEQRRDAEAGDEQPPAPPADAPAAPPVDPGAAGEGEGPPDAAPTPPVDTPVPAEEDPVEGDT